MDSSPGGEVQRADSRVIRLLAGACGFIIAVLTHASCAWAPEIYFQIMRDRYSDLGNPPPGHPEVLCAEVPPSPAEIDLWFSLDAD